MTTNPILLRATNKLLLPSSTVNNVSDIIISNFANCSQNAISKNLTERKIRFDNFDYNIESIKEAERKIIEIVKCIKGELPLPGLVERIDNCITLLDSKTNEKQTSDTKVLKLKANN